MDEKAAGLHTAHGVCWHAAQQPETWTSHSGRSFRKSPYMEREVPLTSDDHEDTAQTEPQRIVHQYYTFEL